MKKKILIAEDNPTDRAIMKKFLEKYDFNIIEAENGLEAFEMATKKHPHIIITDIKMPVADGWQLIEMLRESVDSRHIPVICVSAVESEQEIKEKSEKWGCAAYYKKPVPIEDLIEVIKKL